LDYRILHKAHQVAFVSLYNCLHKTAKGKKSIEKKQT